MAPRVVRTRRAQRPSYREDDSEDEQEEEEEEEEKLLEDSFEEDESDEAAPRRKRRKTDSQIFSVRNYNAPGRPAVRTRRQPQKSYAEEVDMEESDDDDFDDAFDENGVEVADGGEGYSSSNVKRPRTVKRETRKAVNSPRKAPRRREGRRERSSSLPAPLPARTRQPNTCIIKEAIPFISDNKVPPWTTLPYEILQIIFLHACFPLFDDNNAPTPAISWLVKTARVHRAFFEPAMAALYKCPPLLTQTKPHEIQALLSQSPASHSINYNVKVKRLELEYRILAYSAGKDYGVFDLGTLIKHLPQLTEIDVWSIFDTPRVRRVGYSEKPWVYPDTMFDALVEGGQRLKSFHWNGKFFGKMAEEPTKLYQWMHEKHLLTPFQSLRALTLTNFLGDVETRLSLEEPIVTPTKPLTTNQVDKEATREEKRQAVKQQDKTFAKAICALSELNTLDLQMCSIVDSEWLQLLPKTLTSLGITICDRLTSNGLQAFLSSHGSNLKQLVLNHNSSLSISFLTILKATCPRLEEFEMDLTYYSKYASSSSAEPEYENLLLPDEVPTWPKTLRSIDMHHLRQWTSSSAETFLNSLINAAEELPDLRYLGLSISLSISWRERARIRDQWEDKLKRVFLRKLILPNPYWMSLRGFREWKVRQGRRTLSHVEIPTASTPNSMESKEEKPTPAEPEPKSTVGKRKLRPRKSTSDEDSSHPQTLDLDSSLRDMMMQELENHVQGMCDVVDIRIDNLRPTENQMHENDFLDSEPSGDEDWDEGRGDPGEEELFGLNRRSKKGKKRSGYAW